MGCTHRHRSRRHGLDAFIMTSFVIPVQKPTTKEVWKAKESSLLQHSFSLSVLKSGAHDVHWLAPEAQNSLPTHGALLTSQINPLCDTGSHGEGDLFGTLRLRCHLKGKDDNSRSPVFTCDLIGELLLSVWDNGESEWVRGSGPTLSWPWGDSSL